MVNAYRAKALDYWGAGEDTPPATVHWFSIRPRSIIY